MYISIYLHLEYFISVTWLTLLYLKYLTPNSVTPEKFIQHRSSEYKVGNITMNNLIYMLTLSVSRVMCYVS